MLLANLIGLQSIEDVVFVVCAVVGLIHVFVFDVIWLRKQLHKLKEKKVLVIMWFIMIILLAIIAYFVYLLLRDF